MNFMPITTATSIRINMDNPEELRICSNNDDTLPLFGSCRYVIPLYQREYAWRTEVEIERLMADIKDSEPNRSYRLGSLSVMKRSEEFEVIDGQQRLTTIYLLLTAWQSVHPEDGITAPEANDLSFKGRPKSNFTLQNVEKLYSNQLDSTTDDKIDKGILEAYEGLRRWIKEHTKDENKRKNFLDRLHHTIIYRVPVPEDTDLYKFFIRMNTRGKQLELSDVLKARLMKHLCDADLSWFNTLWKACSNMNTFLQKSLKGSLTQEAWDEIFSYESLKKNSFRHYHSTQKSTHQEEPQPTLTKLIQSFSSPSKDTDSATNTSETTAGFVTDFESFIDFPTFLMHVLKLCALYRKDDGQNQNNSQQKPQFDDGATNDAKLLTFFDEKWESTFGVPLTAAGQTPSSSESQSRCSRPDVLEFIRTLVVARYLYDGWVLKRLPDGNDKKEWAIQHRAERTDKQGSDILTNSFPEKLHLKILMMQACLRVTYTSPNTMPWVTKLLHLLWQHRSNPNSVEAGTAVLNLLEGIAIEEVREKLKNSDLYTGGTGTPRILFNFLDYLLWRDGLVSTNEEDEKRRQNFQFAYWNSVEHWYPQTPDDSMHDDWPKQGDPSVDTFGNLFLLNRSENSRLSNLPPNVKKQRLNDKADKGLMLSLKAVDMMRKTSEGNGSWQIACQELESEHIERLQNAQLWTEKHLKETSDQSSEQKPV